VQLFPGNLPDRPSYNGRVEVIPSAEQPVHCSWLWKFCIVLVSAAGSSYPPKSGQSGLPLSGFWSEELEIEGREVRQKSCLVDRAAAVLTLRGVHLVTLNGNSPLG